MITLISGQSEISHKYRGIKGHNGIIAVIGYVFGKNSSHVSSFVLKGELTNGEAARALLIRPCPDTWTLAWYNRFFLFCSSAYTFRFYLGKSHIFINYIWIYHDRELDHIPEKKNRKCSQNFRVENGCSLCTNAVRRLRYWFQIWFMWARVLLHHPEITKLSPSSVCDVCVDNNGSSWPSMIFIAAKTVTVSSIHTLVCVC